jgi:hypothetical protein
VPAFPHEILVDIFRNGGDVVRELLRARADIKLGKVTAELASIDLSQVVPIEYRADNVTVFRNRAHKATLAVVVEVQRKIDVVKRRSWPVYVTVARSSNDCRAVLLVIAPDAKVARWARKPIATGHPGFCLRPIVISYRDMPRVVDPAVTCRIPELGVLSTLAHPSLEVAKAALAGIRGLTDEQQARLYYDVIMAALPEAIRRALEAHMERYEYKTEFARKYVAQGREEGREEGREKGREEGRGMLQRAVIELARAKLGQLSADDEAAIRALRDDDALTTLTIDLGQARDVDQARAALDQATHRPGPVAR